MSSTLAQSQSSQRLRVLDPDLPTLALEAAIDIDKLLSNKTQNLTAMKRLAEQLKDSIQVGIADGPPRSLMDPATLNVLGEAIAEVMKSESLHRIEDFLGKAARIAELLSIESPTDNQDELKQVRNFCLALSRAVMAYHKSILDLRPSHPFRR